MTEQEYCDVANLIRLRVIGEMLNMIVLVTPEFDAERLEIVGKIIDATLILEKRLDK